MYIFVYNFLKHEYSLFICQIKIVIFNRKDVVKSLEQKLQSINPEDKLLPLVAGLIYYFEEVGIFLKL